MEDRELHWQVREASPEHDGHDGMVGYYLMSVDGQEYGVRVDIHVGTNSGIDKVKNALDHMRASQDLARQMFDAVKEAENNARNG